MLRHPPARRENGRDQVVVLPSEFFAPDNLGAIMGASRESTDQYPIFRDYDSRAREYAVNPFTS